MNIPIWPVSDAVLVSESPTRFRPEKNEEQHFWTGWPLCLGAMIKLAVERGDRGCAEATVSVYLAVRYH